MLKNVLLASAAAFVVFGSAASLTNMKAVITSGNGAEAALTRDALDLNAQLTELRVEQARQAALMSVQDTVLDRLQRDLRQGRSGGGAMAGLLHDEDWDIALDLPSAEREQQAVDYFVAWRRALDSQAELASVRADLEATETRYRELESESVAQLSALEASSAQRIAELETEAAEQVARVEAETKFEIARLKEEVEQRDSSIVGLMHRLVSLQTGVAAPAADERPARTAPPAQPKAMPAAVKPEPRAETAAPAREQTAALAPMPAVPMSAASVADGVAAYQAGDYQKAFAIWRPLANAGNARAWFHLGALYYEGRGVNRDLSTAHLLLNKAEGAGHAGATALLSRVEAEMTEAQLAALPAESIR